MKKLISLLLIVFAIPLSASAQSLLGTYKLLSFDSIFEDGTSYSFLGANPVGYIVITPKRFMTMLVSGERQPGRTIDERAALFNSLISYSGPYTIEGSKLFTAVDISWNQSWTGTKQGRTWTIDGNKLILVTDKAPSVKDPSKLAAGRLVWEKVE